MGLEEIVLAVAVVVASGCVCKTWRTFPRMKRIRCDSSCAGGRIHRVHPTIALTDAKSGISRHRSLSRLKVAVVVAAASLLVDVVRVEGICSAVVMLDRI